MARQICLENVSRDRIKYIRKIHTYRQMGSKNIVKAISDFDEEVWIWLFLLYLILSNHSIWAV